MNKIEITYNLTPAGNIKMDDCKLLMATLVDMAETNFNDLDVIGAFIACGVVFSARIAVDLEEGSDA